MKKKTFELIVGITGGVSTIASAVIGFIHPEYTVQFIAAIGIVNTAVAEVCGLFVINDKTKK